MRSSRNIGKALGKVRTGLPGGPAGLLQTQVQLEALAGALRQSLKSPATTIGAPPHFAIQALDDAPTVVVGRRSCTRVHADEVQALAPPAARFAVKHAAALQGMVRDVLVLGAHDR